MQHDFLESIWDSVNQKKAGRACDIVLAWRERLPVTRQGHTLGYFFEEVSEGCAADLLFFSGPINGFTSSMFFLGLPCP